MDKEYINTEGVLEVPVMENVVQRGDEGENDSVNEHSTKGNDKEKSMKEDVTEGSTQDDSEEDPRERYLQENSEENHRTETEEETDDGGVRGRFTYRSDDDEQSDYNPDNELDPDLDFTLAENMRELRLRRRRFEDEIEVQQPELRHPPILPKKRDRNMDIIDRLTLAEKEMANKTPKEKTINELYRRDWYFGDVIKEQVPVIIKGQPDGVFFIRNSTTPGDFTLNFNCNGELKLIKIIIDDDGLCHFQSHGKRFENITKLIEYFKRHSLESYNSTLPIFLKDHMSYDKYIAEKNKTKVKHVSVILHEMYGIHTESERIYKRVEKLDIEKSKVHYKGTMLQRNLSQAIGAEIVYREAIEKMKADLHDHPDNVTDLKIVKALEDNILLQLGRIQELREAQAMTKEEMRELQKVLMNYDTKKHDLYSRYYTLESQRDGLVEVLLSKEVKNLDIQKGIWEATSLVDYESLQMSEFFLDVVLPFGVADWLVIDADKNKATQLIQQAIDRNPNDADGIFLIRPSFTKQGCYALSISVKGHIRHCLVEYSNSQDIEQCGYGFMKSNLYFPSMVDFVKYYYHNSMKDHNPELDVTLKRAALQDS
uniref:Phosphoinositide 3-kinase adapter subunit (inferred by orthology to a C. elegans protein) n=1 Tax=Strongyloides venezuelensis TaxID=75913 RepID=A0A0K0FG67_STRVS